MHILIVDDEPAQRELLAGFLKNKGYTVSTAASGAEAIALHARAGFELVIMDLKMPDLDGIETMARMKNTDPETTFVILTGYGTVESAVRALKLGAHDYLSKPINLDEMELLIERIHDQQITHQELLSLKEEVTEKFRHEFFIAESARMKEIMGLIPRIAKSDSAVLILGESGTGKELIARLVHEASVRKNNRFVPISCAAIPETLIESELFGYERGAFSGADRRKMGKFEMANQGTLFLDEIGDLPPMVQVKLLRVLQEFCFERLGSNIPIKIDVRLISATNQDLKKKIQVNDFREDLYYRLNVFTIELPPLRERKDDIKPLAEFFIRRASGRSHKAIRGISREALNKLVRYDWPGNIRELENVMERAMVLCRGEVIDAVDLPLKTELEKTSFRGDTLAEIEKQHIQSILTKTRWNLGLTADKLGIHRNTLRLKIREYGLEKENQ